MTDPFEHYIDRLLPFRIRNRAGYYPAQDLHLPGQILPDQWLPKAQVLDQTSGHQGFSIGPAQQRSDSLGCRDHRRYIGHIIPGDRLQMTDIESLKHQPGMIFMIFTDRGCFIPHGLVLNGSSAPHGITGIEPEPQIDIIEPEPVFFHIRHKTIENGRIISVNPLGFPFNYPPSKV